MTDIKNNPFLDLLKEGNLNKIKIDKELIPIFKIVMVKMSDYFLQNNLMDAKDWDSMFETYLLTENNNQYHIRLADFQNMEKLGGLYEKQSKEILIRDSNSVATLCHEFIHFLVFADSNSLGWKMVDSFIINEGLTQLLTNEVLDLREKNTYEKEVKLASIYCELSKDKEPMKQFLCDRFVFDNESDLQNIGIKSKYYSHTEDKNAYRDVQKYVIKNLVDINSIDSISSYISLVNILSKRHDYDYEYISGLFDTITDNLVLKMELDEQRRKDLKTKLLNLQKVADYSQMYGDNEVAIYSIDGLRIAFDKQGNRYGDFPADGEQKRGQTMSDMHNNRIKIIHKDKTYIIDTTKMNCINWKTTYNNYLEEFMKEINNNIETKKI